MDPTLWGIQRDTGTTAAIYLFVLFHSVEEEEEEETISSLNIISPFFSRRSSVNYIFNFMEIHDTVLCAFRPVGIEYTGDVKGGTE